MQIRDYDEVQTRFNRERFKSIVDTIEKNIQDVKVELYKTKNLSLKSEDLSNCLTNNFDETNMIIIKKNNEIVLTANTLGLVDKYAMITIYKNKLSDRDYKIILKILSVNNIKKPISHKTFFKWNMILCTYALLSNGLFFSYYYFFTDFFRKRSWDMELNEIIIFIISITLITLSTVILYFFTIHKSKNAVALNDNEFEKI